MVLCKPLSYDCTKHIIKHTDPNTRIFLSLRCPSLKAIEEALPFKCRKLELSFNRTSINGVDYTFDFLPRNYKCFPQLTVKHQNRKHVERIQNKTTASEAHIHFINLLFVGRNKPVKMERLEMDVDILTISKLIKFQTKEVEIGYTSANGFKRLHEVVDISSFPLNFFVVGYINDDRITLEQPMFRSARRVLIRGYMSDQPEFFRRLLELSNENITVQSRLSWITFQTIINNWRTTQRKIGTSLTIERVHTEDVENILNTILGQMQYRENENGLSLSLRCPAIQAFEKSVPFKCRKLQFKENEIIINDVNYTFDMYGEYERFLQLTVKHGNREHIERVQHFTDIFHANIYMHYRLLGGRSEPIRVKRLQMDVIPKQWYTSHELDQLITFEKPMFLSAYQHFYGNDEPNPFEVFRRVLELPNKNITIRSRLSWRNFQTIIDNWRRTQRKVGTTLTIKGIHTDEVEKVLNRILRRWEYRENANGDLIINLYKDKQLRISYGDSHGSLPSCPKLWSELMNFMKLEVIDVDKK
ncbi:hypothetical protein B9Z55_012655 [Caenorhabditis nigoni]|uniref:F-box domain-containing protein n=1 Tax=Caenorhabditis nigoni TaxID=1611254 RepID=A0A2G5TYE6_9PELO|nr:hypothetical protein B9Z55_012655 [Caenorhabditis nigoni]